MVRKQRRVGSGSAVFIATLHHTPQTSSKPRTNTCGWELGEDIFDRYIDRGSVHNYVILYES